MIHIYPRGCKLTERVTLEEACFRMLVVFIILLNGCGVYLQFLLARWDLKLFKLFRGFLHLHGKAFCLFPCWYFSLTHSTGSDKPRGGVIATHRKSKYVISGQLHKSRQMHNLLHLFLPHGLPWKVRCSQIHRERFANTPLSQKWFLPSQAQSAWLRSHLISHLSASSNNCAACFI